MKEQNMARKCSKKEKIQASLIGVSLILIVFGLLFVLTAGKMVPVFPAFYNIPNLILQYVIVIVTMSAGIMLFSNTAATVEDKKTRDIMTIVITAFSTVLTLPLLYVFIALFPAISGRYDAIGELMVKDVYTAFKSIFPPVGMQYLIFSLGVVMAAVFLAFPLITGVLTVKDKALIIGKGGIKIGVLPAAKQAK